MPAWARPGCADVTDAHFVWQWYGHTDTDLCCIPFPQCMVVGVFVCWMCFVQAGHSNQQLNWQ